MQPVAQLEEAAAFLAPTVFNGGAERIHGILRRYICIEMDAVGQVGPPTFHRHGGLPDGRQFRRLPLRLTGSKDAARQIRHCGQASYTYRREPAAAQMLRCLCVIPFHGVLL